MAPTDAGAQVGGAEAEDFAVIAKRYVALGPEARRTIRKKFAEKTFCNVSLGLSNLPLGAGNLSNPHADGRGDVRRGLSGLEDDA